MNEYEDVTEKFLMQVHKDNISLVAQRSGKSEADVYESYLEAQENGSVYFEWVW